MDSFRYSTADGQNQQLGRRLEERLEKSWRLPTVQRPLPKEHPPRGPWRQIGQWLLRSLTDSQQIRVWTRVTPRGTRWYAYDPASNRRVICDSEQALRTWLEQRHLFKH